MRRGGIFAPPLDTDALAPCESDNGNGLDMKWKMWAKRESFKR